ncbi:hypothetical protein AB6A40_002283 [Gnathostoma spinigerum]|uniref:Uncharacterized protein n=1 Tax=Gnathostoma spinigerum TaxID=75299 RepID=A0ABD6EDZ2_9BILA
MISLSIFLFFIVIPNFTESSPRPKSGTNFEHHYRWPPPSYSYMGTFEKAAVTSDNGLCSEIGRNILIKGGNAVDAAIASMFCLGVTNPQSSGLGGGFVMTLYNRSEQKCHILDARETAPNAASREMFLNNPNGSRYGYLAIGVPGELSGYWLAFKKYGSHKVSWYELVKPSVDLCRNGIPVTPYLAHTMKVKEYHFVQFPSMREWINPVTGTTYQTGDIMRRIKLGKTLELIAKSDDPEEMFYRGEMADVMANEIQENGGIITKKDFANYKTREYPPLYTVDFAEDLVMCGGPPPSSFSVTQLIIALLGRYYGPHSKQNILYRSSLFYHRLIEAQKHAYAHRTLLGDVAFVPTVAALAKNMTTKAYIDYIFSRMTDHAQPSEYYLGDQNAKMDFGTSHVSVLDKDGNGASATTTINRWFGAAVQSDEYAIVWNDEMDDFSTPGQENGFGFAPSKTNFIEPGKRPMSSMSPMILFNGTDGKTKMVVGASGGSKIISALAKPVVRVLYFNETIKQAIDAPTLHNQFTPDVTQYDETSPKKLIEDLKTIFGQTFKFTTGFEGIAQGIVVGDDGKIYANGDYRREADMHPGGF